VVQSLISAFVLDYHGCDAAVAERVLRGRNFRHSNNDYDWLGPGVYFWEANPRRGLEWARELKRRGRGKIDKPAVVGAVVEVGSCLDLASSTGTAALREAYEVFAELRRLDGGPMPSNGRSLLRRNLDCAVIRSFHDIRKAQGEPPVDTARGIFPEGKPIYDGAGFQERTHIQICVRNLSRIKGVFRVPRAHMD